jgi:signal peptidase I
MGFISSIGHIIETLFAVLFLPVYLSITIPIRHAKSPITTRSIMSVTGLYLLTFLIITPVYATMYALVVRSVQIRYGLTTYNIKLSGTGSMYPTFPKGHGTNQIELAKEVVSAPAMFPYPNGIPLFGRTYFGHTIEHGDIVVAENDKIREIGTKLYGKPAGIVKRIIGIGGDTIELRDGTVLRNGVPVDEPYIAKARSTFGGVTLPDCTKLRIPQGTYLLMGDNRKSSSDSRHEIGLISDTDIKYVLPNKNQSPLYTKNWRNTSEDLLATSKIILNGTDLLKRINERRKTALVKPLSYQPKLSVSAKKRGNIILSTNDFSFEATRSGYTMPKAMADAGYSNITWGEWTFQGYYDADELADAMFEFSASKKFSIDADFQEFGFAEVEGMINACPTQVIVEHFAGYVPPNYKGSDIASWESLLANLKQVAPSWGDIRTHRIFYEANAKDIERINALIAERISHIEGIVSTMKKNQWLSAEQTAYMKRDETLYKEQDSLAKKLNAKE